MPQHASRIALVTGGASGIGRRIAEKLALEDRATVCIVDRDATTAGDAAASIRRSGGKAAHFVVDLASATATQTMLVELTDRYGSPDIVINSAGMAATVPALEYTLAHWQLTMAVNVTAPMLIIQHALNGMKARGWGRVVNIASISGVRAGTGRLGYGTSKAALIALTRQFAIESAEWGVTVNAVAPGPVDTPLIRSMHGGGTSDLYGAMVPMGRYGAIDEIAHAAQFLASQGSSYITGHTLAVDGGFLASGLLVRDLFEKPDAQATGPVVAAHAH